MKKIFRYLRSQFIPLLFGWLLVVLSLMIIASDNPSVKTSYDRLEGIAYDLRLRFSLPQTVDYDPRIVIVDIDEKSLAKVGRWPWSRNKLADLVDAIFVHEPAVVGLDVLFAEPEVSPLDHLNQVIDPQLEIEIPKALLEANALLDGDTRFAEALAGRPVVLGYAFTSAENKSVGQLPPPLIGLTDEQSELLNLPDMPAFTANISKLEESSANSGFFVISPDSDGVIRRAETLMIFENGIYPSLGIALIHQYFGMPPLELILVEDSEELIIEGLTLSGLVDIPTDSFGRALVPFHSLSDSYRYVSAIDVLNNEVEKETLEGAIILVGTTAAGLFDLRATPVAAVFPGVAVHANLIAGILDEQMPIIASWAQGLDVAVLILVGVLFGILFPLLRPGWLIFLTLIGAIGYIAFSVWMWQAHNLVISISLPVLLILVLGTGNAAYGFLLESKGREQLKSMFGQYVPSELVDEMNANPDSNYGFDGESREMTVLFCDIRSFTTISEKLAADELKRMLNYFFTPMTESIFNHKGTIDKYVGDMIMAFWGAPVNDEGHREHALIGALHMLKLVHEMRDEIKAEGWPEINVGIGLNSGMMNVGDMGSSFRRSYTVIGDAVNLGARLEGLTKFYGVELCVSEGTRSNISQIIFRTLDVVRVKGKNEGIKIYEPICDIKDATSDLWVEISLFEIALESYYLQDWGNADALMSNLLKQHPDTKLYSMYVGRIKEMAQAEYIEAWDGVYTHTSK